jgi:hypothetical protein
MVAGVYGGRVWWWQELIVAGVAGGMSCWAREFLVLEFLVAGVDGCVSS